MNPYLQNIRRIEFVITLACTGRCIHCQNGDDLDRTLHIDDEVAADAVAKIAGIYDIKSVMTFGGEPLLYSDTVCAIHSAAKAAGIPKRQIITNGYFTKNGKRVEEVVGMLATAGVNDLLLSADAFHQKDIPLGTVERFARTVAAAKIPITISPAWLVSKDDPNPYNIETRRIVDVLLKTPGIKEGNGNVVFPGGNAIKYLGEYFEGHEVPEDPYAEDPADLKAVSIGADGSVLGGNVYVTDILDIMERYRP